MATKTDINKMEKNKAKMTEHEEQMAQARAENIKEFMRTKGKGRLISLDLREYLNDFGIIKKQKGF